MSVSWLDARDDGRRGLAHAGSVSLLDVDAGIAAAVPAEDHRLARRVLVADRHLLGAGSWCSADALRGDRAPFMALVLDGVLVQEVSLSGRTSAQLLGAGDVVRPWPPAATALPCSVRWTSVGGAALAVADDRFVPAARRWPELIIDIHERVNDQLDDALRRLAVCALPRVEDRILALFWQLADRFGVVRPDGVLLRLALTHDLIGRLIAAKRPTVSLGLTALASRGHVRRPSAGAWLLSHASVDALGDGAGDADVARTGHLRPVGAAAS